MVRNEKGGEKYMTKFLTFILAAVGIYSAAIWLFHAPFSGFLLLPLLLCGAMFLFMDHGSETREGKSAKHAH